MALDIDNPTHEHRPLGFVMLGVLLLSATGYLMYDMWYRDTEPAASATAVYRYNVTQTVDTGVKYFQSSFYDDSPGVGDSAYVSQLTDTVSAKLRYKFTGTQSTELTAMYSAAAVIRAKYIAGAEVTDTSTVWSEDYPLIKPVTTTKNDREVSFTPTVTIPFAEYRQKLDQFKNSLAVPITSEAVITFIVRVSGTIDGSPIDDVRTSTVSMPLDQPLFTLANKFQKEDEKQIVAQVAKNSQVAMRTYEQSAIIVLAVLGVVAVVYGMRKKIFKNSYQRELEKIYRYHDGIIIHARRPSMVTDKNTVPVRSFDDILNIEEETKQPIIAYPLGDEATQFIIVKDDVVYTYTLGKELIDHEDTELKEATESTEEKQKPRYRKVQ